METKIARLQYITDSGDPETILRLTTAFLEGGGRWVQLRMKEAGDGLFLETARAMRELTRRYGAALIINDRADIAARCDADGVHLGKSDIETTAARRLLDGRIIGRTANTLDDILKSAAEGADYIGLGPFRFTTTKQNLSPLIGLEGYRRIYDEMHERGIEPLPIVGIGGVVLSDVEALSHTGLYGLAVSSAITRAENPQNAASTFLDTMTTYFDK